MRTGLLVVTLGFRVCPHRSMARLAVETITQVAISSTLLAPISFPSTDAQLQRRRAMVKQPNFWKKSENSGKNRSCSGWKDFQICTQKQQVNCITKLPWAVCNKIRRQDTPWPQDRNEDKSLTTQRPELCQQAWEKKKKNKGTCDVLRTRELPRNQQVLARSTAGLKTVLTWVGGVGWLQYNLQSWLLSKTKRTHLKMESK